MMSQSQVSSFANYTQEEIKTLPRRDFNVKEFAEKLNNTPVGHPDFAFQLNKGNMTDQSTYFQFKAFYKGEVISNSLSMSVVCPVVYDQEAQYKKRVNEIEAMPMQKGRQKPKAYPPNGTFNLYFKEAAITHDCSEDLFNLVKGLTKHLEPLINNNLQSDSGVPMTLNDIFITSQTTNTRGIAVHCTVPQDPSSITTEAQREYPIIPTLLYDAATGKQLRHDTDPDFEYFVRSGSSKEAKQTNVKHSNIHEVMHYGNLLAPMYITMDFRVPNDKVRGANSLGSSMKCIIRATRIMVNRKYQEDNPEAFDIQKSLSVADEYEKKMASRYASRTIETKPSVPQIAPLKAPLPKPDGAFNFSNSFSSDVVRE